MTIATSIQEILNYPGLEYYHYKLMEYLKGKFAKTTVYMGVVDGVDKLPEATEEEPIQNGATIFVSGEFVKDGNRYPNGATFIYNNEVWEVVNPTNLSYDIEWSGIGNGNEYRKMFSVPAGASVILACSAVSGSTTFNDIILYSNNGNDRVNTDLCTLKEEHLALYHDVNGDICVGTNDKLNVPLGNKKYTFKVLYSSCDPKEITWYNEKDNTIVTSETISKESAYVLCNGKSVVIDKDSDKYNFVVADKDGNADCNFGDYNQFTVDTSGVEDGNKLIVDAGNYANAGSTYIIEVTDKVPGMDIVYRDEPVIGIEEDLYNGDKVIVQVSVSEDGEKSFVYNIIKSDIISSNGSITVEKLSNGTYDITTRNVDVTKLEKISNKTDEVDTKSPSSDKYVSEKGLVDFLSSGGDDEAKTRRTYEQFNFGQANSYYLVDKFSGDKVQYNAVYRISNLQGTPDATGIFAISLMYNTLAASGNKSVADLVWLSGHQDTYVEPYLTYSSGVYRLYVRHRHPKNEDEWKKYYGKYLSGADTSASSRVLGCSLVLLEDSLVDGTVEHIVPMGGQPEGTTTQQGNGVTVSYKTISDVTVDGVSVVDEKGIAQIEMPVIPDLNGFQTVANKVDTIDDSNIGDNSTYPSTSAAATYITQVVEAAKGASVSQEFSLAEFAVGKDFTVVLGRVEPLGTVELMPGDKIGGYTYQSDEKYVTETNKSFNEIKVGYGKVTPNDGVEWCQTVLVESDCCASGLYRFECKTRGNAANEPWNNIYYITRDNNDILKPFSFYNSTDGYFYYGFKIPAITDANLRKAMLSKYGSFDLNKFKATTARVYIIENNLKYGRLYYINKTSGANNFVMRSCWNTVSYPFTGMVPENVLDNNISDIQVDGKTVIDENGVANIVMPKMPDLSAYQRTENLKNEWSADIEKSQVYYPSLNYITNYFSQQKKSLTSITAGSATKAGLWNMIKVTGLDGHDTGDGPKYKTTFIVTGGDKNPDYYGICEVQFGYDRDKSPTSPAYKYCVANWLGYKSGTINPNGAIELKVYTSKQYDTLYICASTQAGCFMNLEFLEEESTSADVKNLQDNNITAQAPNLINVKIGILNQCDAEELTNEQLAALKIMLDD